MTQTTFSLRSFFNGGPLTLEEHKSLPYRISTVGKDNAYQVARVENTAWLTELIDDEDDSEIYESEIESIVEMLIEGETIRDTVENFIDSHGVCELEFFQDYQTALDEWSEHTVDAFLENWDISDVEHIGSAFYGHFDSIEEFIDDYMEQIGNDVPSWIVIDYDRTWDSGLRFDFDFDESNGIMWMSNW